MRLISSEHLWTVSTVSNEMRRAFFPNNAGKLSILFTCSLQEVKLEKSFFVVGHGTITVHCMYTSIKGFIFIEKNGR